jgi:energy-coupling factor transport system permease protein
MPVGYSLYVDTPSTLHQAIDPRTKLVGLAASFVLALEFNDPKFLGAILGGLLLIGLWARLPFRRLMPFLAAAGWFLIVGMAIWPAYVRQGPVLFTVFHLPVTLDGLLFGLAMGLRVAIMSVGAGIWMLTTAPQKLMLGLLKIGLPYRAGLAMSTTIRFIPLINAERLMISEAQRARALNLDTGNPFARASKSVAVIGPLFLRALALSQALAMAMEARGMGARDHRTSIVEIQLTPTDWAIMSCALVTVIVGLVMRLMGVGILVKGYL